MRPPSKILFLALGAAIGCGGASSGAKTTTSSSSSSSPTIQQTPSRDKIETLRSGIAEAWRLTSEGYALLGGRPSLASKAPIPKDKIPAARAKFEQSQAVLDRSEPTAEYPHDQYRAIYTHSDFVRASNLHALGMMRLFERDAASAERHVFRAVDLAEGAFAESSKRMSELAWADNARKCARLLVELHGFSAFVASAKKNAAAQDQHMSRMQELARWLETNR